MGSFKRLAGLIGAVVFVFAAAGLATTAYLTHAQTTGNTPGTAQNQTANGMPGRGFWHSMGPAVFGTVTNVSGNTLTVAGRNNTAYTVDASQAQISKLQNGQKTAITAAQIQTGDTVAAFGILSGTTLTAKNIVDGQLPAKAFGQRPQPAVQGTVSSINGNTLTVTDSSNTAWTVDASQALTAVFKSKEGVANSGIETGDRVTVFGSANGNAVAATRIRDGDFPAKGMRPFGQLNTQPSPTPSANQ